MTPKTLFATHYHELTDLESMYKRVKNYRVDVSEEGDRVVFLRRIVEGGADKSYGIEVARLAGLPRSVIARARQIQSAIESRSQRRVASSAAIVERAASRSHGRGTPSSVTAPSLFDAAVHGLIDELAAVDCNSMTPLEALSVLHSLSERAREEARLCRDVMVLDEATINKIAAGEVVERPSSVIKELVENSIDAEARRISVSIENGGLRSISVVDDGVGMGRMTLRALERHATSKIRSSDDIFRVATLGFRGEALPSIAAVSRLTMITREAGSPGGTRITAEAGKKPVATDHPAAPGTSVAVKDLFYNTPARRKYLKSPATETRRVIEVVTGEALAHPEIAFTLESDGRRLLFTSGSGDLLQTFGELAGIELAKSLVKFAGGASGLSVHGYISSPSIARSSRRDLYLMVNGRPVTSGLLVAAVAKAYGPAMPKGRYPVGAVVVTIEPEGSMSTSILLRQRSGSRRTGALQPDHQIDCHCRQVKRDHPPGQLGDPSHRQLGCSTRSATGLNARHRIESAAS